jgi:hypothetical protein
MQASAVFCIQDVLFGGSQAAGAQAASKVKLRTQQQQPPVQLAHATQQLATVNKHCSAMNFAPGLTCSAAVHMAS